MTATRAPDANGPRQCGTAGLCGPNRSGGPTGRGDAGLMTLEWLLIVGAIAGIAATTALVVQRVVDDSSEVATDPLVRVLQADVAAAFVAADAQSTLDGNPAQYTTAVDQPFRDRCNPGIGDAFDDVVDRTLWTSPAGPDGVGGTVDDVAARCDVTPKPNLGA